MPAAAALFDARGPLVLLYDHDRVLWNAYQISGGAGAYRQALRHRAGGLYQIRRAIAALHCRVRKARSTDWKADRLPNGRWISRSPSPLVTLNRAVAVSKVRGAEAALEMISRSRPGYPTISILRSARRIPDALPQR